MLGHIRRLGLALIGALGLGHFNASAAPEPMPAGAIAQELRSFRSTGTVLYIAAHPDDENTRLLAYFSRERGYRTGYLSLTRGDGGQNLLGPELRDELGVIRTQELLAARRVDGGHQFFTRANDFGFSKDYAETLSLWNRDQVLADMVRVIRTFRPDVLVTRFSTKPGGTHGHHTASAILALEAFKLAGDPNAFRAELGGLAPWQPKRIFWNSSPFGRAAPPAGALRLDTGGYNPLLGESYGEIAARSRTMHKSQGMGTLGARGTTYDYFTLLAGEPASTDLFDGVDTTWARVPGGAEIGALADAALAAFKPQDPAASVPALLEIRRRLAALPVDAVVTERRAQLDRIIQACLGLYFETATHHAEVIAGETLKLDHNVVLRSAGPVRWVAVRYPTLKKELPIGLDLIAEEPASRSANEALPANMPLSQPYWLRSPGTTGMFVVDDPSLIGRPENPPVLPVEQVFAVGGQTLVLADEPVQVIRDPLKGEVRRALQVIPPLSLEFAEDLVLFAPGATRTVEVEVTASRPDMTGSLHLETPAGWKTFPATQPFHLAAAGDKTRLVFTVQAPARSVTANIVAVADVGGTLYRNRRIEIRYDHIPQQLLQPVAQLKAVSLELATRGKKIGYLPGAGDATAAALVRMGYAVTELTNADLSAERLKDFDAVVIGVRAYNTRASLAARLPALFAYVEAGGTVVAQYNTPNGLRPEGIAPFRLHVSQDRVTDETATMTILAPDHPALNTPNKITPADFDGWVQERGLYFPDQWDPAFTPLFSVHDAGEKPLSGSLLVARHGRGYFVYTGLSFFRELPEGVPGAYRLFANLVSLGK